MVCKVTVCKIDDEIGGFWCQAEPRMGEEGKSSEMVGCSRAGAAERALNRTVGTVSTRTRASKGKLARVQCGASD